MHLLNKHHWWIFSDKVFEHFNLRRIPSSGMWHRVDRVNRRFGGTFRVEKSACKKPPAHAGFSLAEFFYPEDGGDTFLRNVGSHKIYMAPRPRRRHSS
jgi:hypothetical protein